ncbi:MAG: redoxin domain-containing protein [Thermoleophilaceae bacterium]|nr:redoxin domain-containing protein [Thermoleophilaceae bacterium]
MSQASATAAGVTKAPAPAADGPGAPRRSRPWLRAAVVVGALAFLALLGYGVASEAPERTIDESLARGEAVAAPGFDLPVLQTGSLGSELETVVGGAAGDGRVSLDELRGTPVVLNFWASWCEPCRTEAKVLEDSWRSARGREVLFVGLNMQDLTDDAREFIAEFDNTYLNVRDESNGVAVDWGVTGLPETFFVSPEGEVVAHVIGAVSPEQLEAGVRAAERGRPLGSIEGGDRRSVR